MAKRTFDGVDEDTLLEFYRIFMPQLKRQLFDQVDQIADFRRVLLLFRDFGVEWVALIDAKMGAVEEPKTPFSISIDGPETLDVELLKPVHIRNYT